MPSYAYAALAAGGCMLLGVSWAASLRRRAAALKGWARAAVRLEAGLSYRVQSLQDLLDLAASGEENRDVRLSLARAAQRMRENPLTALAEAMGEEKMPELTDGDRAALSPLWTALGSGDEESQRALVRSVRSALKAQIDEAEDRERRDRRLCFSLGVIGGFAVFLFLM